MTKVGSNRIQVRFYAVHSNANCYARRSCGVLLRAPSSWRIGVWHGHAFVGRRAPVSISESINGFQVGVPEKTFLRERSALTARHPRCGCGPGRCGGMGRMTELLLFALGILCAVPLHSTGAGTPLQQSSLACSSSMQRSSTRRNPSWTAGFRGLVPLCKTGQPITHAVMVLRGGGDEGLGGGDRQEGWGTLDLNAADPVKLPCRARPAEAPQANSVRPWLLGVKIFVSSRAGP
jgi:hypothetical protein